MTDGAHQGLFISLEGGEGAGKSTQIKRLKQWCEDTHPERDVIVTREPGGTEGAEAIRDLLVQGDTNKFTAKTDALLMLASRVEHVERLLKPALSQGAIILCDRFSDSSFVYQALSEGGFDEPSLRHLHQMAIDSFVPDITYLFDLPPAVGLARAGARANQSEARFESKGLAFHEAVRSGYLTLAKEYPRIEVIDATQTEDELFAHLTASLARHMSARGW